MGSLVGQRQRYSPYGMGNIDDPNSPLSEDYSSVTAPPANPIDSYQSSPQAQATLSQSGGGGVDSTGQMLQVAGAAALPFMATPVGAAVAVGSQLLSNYLAQDAADKRAAKERRMQIAQQQGAGEQRGLENLMNAYRGMTRG